MKPKLYLETSVVSYLAARPSQDIVVAGQQASSRRWWKEGRRNYDVFASKLVWQEAGKGNREAVDRRLKFIRSLLWLQVTSEAVQLAKALIGHKALPPNAAADATHIALSAVHEMEFLLTWNFTHINNPSTEEQVRVICQQHGFHCPVVCTPDQLL